MPNAAILLERDPERDNRGRLRGVDSIRAVAACVVVFGHLGLFSDSTVHSSSRILSAAARISLTTWNGPAAVMVFFVVSGFCIHLPFRGDRRLAPASFLSRRLLRVGLPLLCGYILSKFILNDMTAFLGVSWSVFFEIVYYLLYPVIRPIAVRVGWTTIFLSTYLVSVVLGLANLHRLQLDHNGYNALGLPVTCLIGIPCWFLGCCLAEKERLFPLVSSTRIWVFRLFIFALSVVLRVAKFHVSTPFASNIFTLNLFAVVALFWLGCEIAYYKKHNPWRFLEWVGTWSYSIYLTHILTGVSVALIGSQLLTSVITFFHPTLILLAFAFSYVFYWIVEFPSHRLAIAVSRRLTRRAKHHVPLVPQEAA